MTSAASQAARGEVRAEGPSLQDLLVRDQSSVPSPLQAESYQFLGDEDIPYSNYTLKERLDAEFEKLWPKVWQWACREEHIPEPGDFYVYDIGHLSAVVVRTEKGEVKAFYNACMHRGTQLKQPGSCGFFRESALPVSWLDLFARWGNSSSCRRAGDFPHAGAKTHSLAQVRVGLWLGFVFVNFDAQAAPLEEHLGVLKDHFENLGIEDRYLETHVQKRLPANWKAAAEAFLEAYHVKENTCWWHARNGSDDPVRRVWRNRNPFLSIPSGRRIHASTHRKRKQELLDRMWVRGLEQDENPRVPEGMTARDFYADHMKRALGEAYGEDFSCVTLDSNEYFLFPNAFFLPGAVSAHGLQIPARCGRPDYCTFDLLMLRPLPPDGKVPPPPEPIMLDVDDSYRIAEALGRLGAVYDQDTGNMAAQTRGFKCSPKTGQDARQLSRGAHPLFAAASGQVPERGKFDSLYICFSADLRKGTRLCDASRRAACRLAEAQVVLLRPSRKCRCKSRRFRSRHWCPTTMARILV